MLVVEPLLAGVEAGDLGLEGGEVALGALDAGDGVLAGEPEPAHLVVGRGGAGPERAHLAGEPGQALAAVGRRALERDDAAVLLGGGVLGRAARRHGGLERGAVLVDLGGDLLLLGAHPLGVGLELVGVAALLAHLLAGCGGVADALGGQALGAAEPFAQRAERVLHLLGGGERRQVLPQRGLDGGLGVPRRRDLRLHLLAALDQHRLVGDLLVEGGARRRRGRRPSTGRGVAGVGLHAGGLAGHLGLASERLQLAPDLREQVAAAG